MTPPDLRASLLGYAPGDAVEAGHVARVLRLLETSPAPYSRHAYDPGHVTGSAFVYSPAAGRVLLLRHKKLNRWLQPGWHLEPGDDGPRAAALREAREETGLPFADLAPAPEAPFDVDVHPIPPRGDEPGHDHYDLRYLLLVDGLPDLANAETEARWFSADELRELQPDSGLTRMIGKVFGGWAG